MSMSTSTQSVGEEIRVLEVTLELGNKLQKLKQDEASISKKIKGLENQLKSARNIDLETCQKKLASLQEVSDTFGDDDDDAEVLEVTKLLIPKCVRQSVLMSMSIQIVAWPMKIQVQHANVLAGPQNHHCPTPSK